MFALRSAGHFFAGLGHDIKAAATWLGHNEGQIEKDLEKGAVIVSALDPKLAPMAKQIDRAGEYVLGEALAVAAKLSDAEAAHGASLTLDQAVIGELKDLLKGIAALKPGATQVPVGLLPPQ